jgi:hypothetical protein
LDGDEVNIFDIPLWKVPPSGKCGSLFAKGFEAYFAEFHPKDELTRCTTNKKELCATPFIHKHAIGLVPTDSDILWGCYNTFYTRNTIFRIDANGSPKCCTIHRESDCVIRNGKPYKINAITNKLWNRYGITLDADCDSNHTCAYATEAYPIRVLGSPEEEWWGSIFQSRAGPRIFHKRFFTRNDVVNAIVFAIYGDGTEEEVSPPEICLECNATGKKNARQTNSNWCIDHDWRNAVKDNREPLDEHWKKELEAIRAQTKKHIAQVNKVLERALIRYECVSGKDAPLLNNIYDERQKAFQLEHKVLQEKEERIAAIKGTINGGY